MSEKYILYKALDIIYFVTDKDGNIIYQNETFKDYMSHIKPKSVSDILSDESDQESYVNAVNKSKETLNIPFKVWLQMKQKNGTTKWHKFNVTTLLEETYFIGFIVNDIVSITQDEFQAQSRLLYELNHMINHDNIQPLTAALGLVNMLEGPDNIVKMLRKCIEQEIEAQALLAKKISRKP